MDVKQDMNQQELDALINLLDDPDDKIYSQIRDKILSYGQEVIPFLEDAWEAQSLGVLFQSRVEDLVHTIQFNLVFEELKEWRKSGARDLLKGALLIARYQYPDLNEDKLLAEVDRIKQDVWIELNNQLTALEKVRILNHLFFDVHGFSGNTSNYHAPQNSYINNVVESKKGNPLSLAVLYSVIARELGMPVYGVNLPRHFVLVYLDPVSLQNNTPINEAEALFYINPFSKGGVFSSNEIHSFLKQLKLKPRDSYFKPSPNIKVIKRMVNNLIFSYEKLGYPDKVDELRYLMGALTNS